MGPKKIEKTWVPIAISCLLCLLFFAISFNMGLVVSFQSVSSILSVFPLSTNFTIRSCESRLDNKDSEASLNYAIPRFAYFLYGSKGDLDKLWRTLQ
ncbi:hypothetical protein CRG98_023298, partial [Punica granatum]